MDTDWKPRGITIGTPSYRNAAGNALGVLYGNSVGILVGSQTKTIGYVLLGILLAGRSAVDR
eukprot:5985061-Pyramimonas_sp.AAC.1